MKKYFLVYFVCAVFVVGGVFIYNQKNPLISSVGKKSVEFDIAELSPAGETAGYAMPASGGSPPQTTPGCSLTVEPRMVNKRDLVDISWIHGIVDTSGTQQNATDNSFDVTPGLGRWKVSDDTCLAYCNLNKGTCDPSDTDQWKPVKYDAGKLALKDDANNQNKDVPGVVYAGSSGDGGCSNAKDEQKSVVIKANKSGNFVIGIDAYYVARYGRHHTVDKTNYCYAPLFVNTDTKPELVGESLIGGEIFSFGEDIALESVIRNTGSAPTNHKINPDGSRVSGKFNYRILLDVGNDGFVDGVGGDMTFTSGGDTLGPLAEYGSTTSDFQTTVSPIWNVADVSLGTSSVQVCVDTNGSIPEIQEGNNCSEWSVFSVETPDVAALALPGIYYAVYGEPLQIKAYALNVGLIAITTPFSNQIEIRNGATEIINDANDVASLDVGLASLLTVNGIDHESIFGTARNLEYKVWVDTNDVLNEVAPDNVRPDTVGNNDSSGWSQLQLEYPEVRPVPVDINGAAEGYWGPFVFESDTPVQPVFDVRNETPQGLAIATTFNSVMAVDIDGDCADGATKDDACIDYTTTVTTAGIAGNDASRKRPSWTPARIGTYRARLYADTDDMLPEGNEANNTTPWVTFEVIDALPGQDVTLTADPSIVRKGQSTTLSWNTGGHTTASCQILKNNTNDVVTTIGSTTGTYTVTPFVTTEYLLQCAGDGTYSPASSRITVQVLPVLYES